MSKGIFSPSDSDSLYFSRADDTELLGTYQQQPFFLEDRQWPTIEHYFQAMKFEDEHYQEKIRQADSAKKARKMGRTRFKKVRPDWRKTKAAYMTRAIYTLCRTYPDTATNLLNTGDKTLVENSQYDYYWGCGRDRRGTNMYGQVLMNVRQKLREEANQPQQD